MTLYLAENMFWFSCSYIGSFELYVTKSSYLVFRWKTRCFGLHSTENIFWLFSNQIELLWAFYRKKQRLCFFLAKTRCTQLYSTKKYFGLFPVKLCGFQRYCTGQRFSLSLQRVTLIFPWFYSKQRFCLCLAKLHCSRILLLRTTFSSSFASKLHFSRSILPKKCFSLLVTKLGCFEPLSTKNMFWLVWCQIGLPAALLHW